MSKVRASESDRKPRIRARRDHAGALNQRAVVELDGEEQGLRQPRTRRRPLGLVGRSRSRARRWRQLSLTARARVADREAVGVAPPRAGGRRAVRRCSGGDEAFGVERITPAPDAPRQQSRARAAAPRRRAARAARSGSTGGPSIWARLTRWRSVKIRLKLIAWATSSATAITNAIWPIRLFGSSRFNSFTPPPRRACSRRPRPS